MPLSSIDRLSACYLAVFHLQFIKINSCRYVFFLVCFCCCRFSRVQLNKIDKRTKWYTHTKWNHEESNISVFFTAEHSRFCVTRQWQQQQCRRRRQQHHWMTRKRRRRSEKNRTGTHGFGFEIRVNPRWLRMRGIVKARNQNECNKTRAQRWNRPQKYGFPSSWHKKRHHRTTEHAHAPREWKVILLFLSLTSLYCSHSMCCSVFCTVLYQY